MTTKELSEAAVEFNCIIENMSKDIVKKIPNSFITFLKSIESKSYEFNYDKKLKLQEQKLKPATKGLIALVYQDYLCNEDEKLAYKKICENHFKHIDIEKIEKYDTNNLFKKSTSSFKTTSNNLSITSYQESIFTKIKIFFKSFFLNK